MTPSAQPVPAAAPAPAPAHTGPDGQDAHAHAGPYGHPQPVPAFAGYPAGYYYAPPPPGRFTALMMRLYGRFPVWAAPAAILACFLGTAALVLWSNPADSNAASTPSCLVKLTTGLDCPGCGGTRAFWYLLHGNLPAAARHHLIAVFAAPFLVYAYIAWAGNAVFGTRLPQLRVSPRAVSIFLGAWAVFSVARNLPWAPFTWFYV
jgi:hypothetical protein